MRILIVYDSTAGTAGDIIKYIAEGARSMRATVDIAEAGSAGSLDYDLIVAGSPIYDEMPVKSVESFLRRHELKYKRLAIFVICLSGVFGKRDYKVRKYLERLISICPGHIIADTSFGPIEGPRKKLSRNLCLDFGRQLAAQYREESAMHSLPEPT